MRLPASMWRLITATAWSMPAKAPGSCASVGCRNSRAAAGSARPRRTRICASTWLTRASARAPARPRGRTAAARPGGRGGSAGGLRRRRRRGLGLGEGPEAARRTADPRAWSARERPRPWPQRRLRARQIDGGGGITCQRRRAASRCWHTRGEPGPQVGGVLGDLCVYGTEIAQDPLGPRPLGEAIHRGPGLTVS